MPSINARRGGLPAVRQQHEGLRLYAAAKAARLEGLVTMRLRSRYTPGERSEKFKVRGAVPPERFS